MFVVEAICSLADMFVYNMGDGKPRFLVGTVRLAGDARIVTVSRIFALEMDPGAKQKADALMTETPMKKPYLGPDDT
eukprot:s5592_g5.t1